MKTLRMFGLALLIIVMGMSLASCSKDDSASGNKRLTKLFSVPSSGGKIGWTFSYDGNGNLDKVQLDNEWNGQTYSEAYQFSWSGNVVDVRKTNGSDNAKYTFTIENGLIRSAKMTRDSYTENYTYTYFSNRIERIDLKSGESKNYTEVAWDGDKLTKISESYSGSSTADKTTKLTYSQTCSKGYCPLLPQMINSHSPYDLLHMAHPELIGARTTQLPSSVNVSDNNNNNNDSYNITYEIGKDGYISKMSRDGYTVTLIWE